MLLVEVPLLKFTRQDCYAARLFITWKVKKKQAANLSSNPNVKGKFEV
jgi:hypothetical protein